MRAQEGLLQRVLGVLAVAEHVPAERQQRRVMAVVEHLERSGVTPADERGEALVVEPAEPPRSDAMLVRKTQRPKDDPMGPGTPGPVRVERWARPATPKGGRPRRG